jgi:flagellar export protein FliJ
MFNFELQTILDVRKTLEDKILQEFSQQQRELQREDERLQSIRQQKRDLIDQLRSVQGKTVNVSEISRNAEGIQGCLKSEQIQKEQVDKATRMTEIKKEALFDAIKKRKSIEILKTKQFNQYQSDLNLLERSAIDEMALVRHNRKREE